jgi:hypothetical protein
MQNYNLPSCSKICVEVTANDSCNEGPPNSFTWSSSPSGIVTINSNGNGPNAIISAIGNPGDVTVVTITYNGGSSSSFQITITTCVIPVTQGGTGISSVPSDHVLIGNGVNPVSTLALPSSDVVGRTATQTLTNKTLSSTTIISQNPLLLTSTGTDIDFGTDSNTVINFSRGSSNWSFAPNAFSFAARNLDSATGFFGYTVNALDSGVALDRLSGVQSQLGVSFSWSGGNYSNTSQLSWERVGREVTITFNAFANTTMTTPSVITSTTALPSYIRPLSDIDKFVGIVSNGGTGVTNNIGRIKIQTNGIMIIGVGKSGANFPGTGFNGLGSIGNCVTYYTTSS